MTQGKIIKVSGPLVVASGMQEATWSSSSKFRS